MLTFVFATYFVIENYESINQPEIVVLQNSNLPAFRGDLVSLRFSVKSIEDLKSVQITPSIGGANEDCYVEYSFDPKTKIATIDYFYTLPQDLGQVDSITLTLDITDVRGTIQVAEVIPVYNPPLFALSIDDASDSNANSI